MGADGMGVAVGHADAEGAAGPETFGVAVGAADPLPHADSTTSAASETPAVRTTRAYRT
jgi:hypothetical protein